METSGQMVVALGAWLSGFVSPLDDTRASWKGSCHSRCWLQVVETCWKILKPVINLVSLLQVGAPGVPFRHSHCLISANGCTLGNLTFYFAKARWEKMMSWLFKFWSLPRKGRQCVLCKRVSTTELWSVAMDWWRKALIWLSKVWCAQGPVRHQTHYESMAVFCLPPNIAFKKSTTLAWYYCKYPNYSLLN